MFEIQSNFEKDGKYYIEIDCGEFYTINKDEYDKVIKNGFVVFDDKNKIWNKF